MGTFKVPIPKSQNSLPIDGVLPMPHITAQIRGQLLAAAGTWRTDETQREPEMRIGVWVGAIRCFSAPQPRSASLPRRLRCHCSGAPLPAFPRPGARSRPFDPAAVRICCPFVSRCGSLCGFGCAQVKGQRQRGCARSWRPSFRGHRDRDDGRQDADGGDAEKHRLVLYLSLIHI